MTHWSTIDDFWGYFNVLQVFDINHVGSSEIAPILVMQQAASHQDCVMHVFILASGQDLSNPFVEAFVLLDEQLKCTLSSGKVKLPCHIIKDSS